MPFEADVAIVGAGAAGLAAARLLARHRLRCVLLEGATMIGGRLRTLRRPGWQMPIELGAEFVHGRPAPTLALGGGAVELVHVPEQRVRVDAEVQPMPDTWPRFAAALGGALNAPVDQSIAEYLQGANLQPEQSELVRLIVQGYHAAPLDDVAARPIAEDAARSATDFEQFRTARGYDQVLASLEHGLPADAVRLQLGRRVTRIAWCPGAVTLETTGTAGPAQLSSKCCLVTASLGVLQARPVDGGIVFEPEPPTFRRTLPLLGMGSVVRVVLRFAPGPALPVVAGVETSFVHVPGAPFDTLWREARAGQAQITAWSGGPAARELLRLGPSRWVDAALESLARAVGSSVSDCRSALIEAHYHDFENDPLTRGAYSYVRPGGESARQTLAEPWEKTVFWAGEALDLQHPSTVAGALGSGEHAAREIVAALSAQRP